jgi:potassium channel subfamily K
MPQLYDIPALTQRWYALDGVELPDPAPNLALSALGLAFNVIANGLLVFRFSARTEWWKTAMILSTTCWTLKVGCQI